MSATDDLLGNAKQNAARFDKGDLPLPPARKVALVEAIGVLLRVAEQVVGGAHAVVLSSG